MKDDRINLKVDRQTKAELENLKLLYGFNNQRDLVKYLLLVYQSEIKDTISMTKHMEYVNVVKDKEV